MAPNLLHISTPALSLLAFLLAPLSQVEPVNAAPTVSTTTPQTTSTSKKPCNPEPCANLAIFPSWTPYCNQQGALYCTVGGGMVTIPMGRCEEWCQPPEPEPPKPDKCPPPRPPQNCELDDPCAGMPAELQGWEPYCYQGTLYCTVGPGMITVAVGRCEQWCQPEPEKPEGCP